MPHFLVVNGRGPAWDPSRRRRAQAGWDEHAAFLDGLVERGVVVLGGPVGPDVDAGDALLLLDAPDEATVRHELAADPWQGGVLTIKQVQPWALWLRPPTLSAGEVGG